MSDALQNMKQIQFPLDLVPLWILFLFFYLYFFIAKACFLKKQVSKFLFPLSPSPSGVCVCARIHIHIYGVRYWRETSGMK